MDRFPTWLVLLSVLWLLGSTEGRSDALRIGYVDMQRVSSEAPQVAQARASIDREFRPLNEALVLDEQRLERLEATLAESGPLLEQRQRLEREALNLRRSIERRQEDLAEALRFRTNAEARALETTIELAIRQVAQAEGYDLVLTSPVAYAAASIDMTEAILDWLRQDMGATPP